MLVITAHAFETLDIMVYQIIMFYVVLKYVVAH